MTDKLIPVSDEVFEMIEREREEIHKRLQKKYEEGKRGWDSTYIQPISSWCFWKIDAN